MFVVTCIAVITGRLLNRPVLFNFFLFLFFGLSFLSFYPYYYLAKQSSKKFGLGVVILLPLWKPWGRFIIRKTFGVVEQVERMYEVHIVVKKGLALGAFLKLLEHDLEIMQGFKGTLFCWETNAPIPGRFRKIIKQRQSEGKASWMTGYWPMTIRIPFTSKELRKGVDRYGYFITDC